MKKILLATTMLAASAGFASAEMAVTGTARMGVVSSYINGEAQAAFSSRFRIIFTGSGTTDGGLTFGATARADQSAPGLQTDTAGNVSLGGGAVGNEWMNEGTVYLAGSFGTLTMGDAGDVIDTLVGQVSAVGYTSIGSRNEIGYLDRHTTGVQYDYSANGLSFALGAGQLYDNLAGTDLADSDADNFVSAAVKYATDQYSIALGYQTNEGDSQLAMLGSATFSGATVKLKLVDQDSWADMDWAISVDYTMNGVGLTAFYNAEANLTATDVAGVYDGGAAYGIGASYDLGGGASVVGGIVQQDSDNVGPLMDLGVKMSF